MSVANPTVSVIFTVLNEANHIQRLLDSLLDQTRPPDEIVICDGGSADGTVQIIEQFAKHAQTSSADSSSADSSSADSNSRATKVTLVVEAGANISRGRNVAIAAAAGPIIASTDVGVRLDQRWLEKLVEPWDRGADPLAVAGFFLPDVDSAFTAAMSATVLPLHDDIDPDKFLPSSRSVAFTKESWQAASGYPEWLDFCEDLLFDFAINAQQQDAPTAFSWAPEAIAYFQPRTNLVSFGKQYYQYARGDGKADLWRKRHAIRYVTYLLALPILIGFLHWGGAWSWLGWLGLIAGGLFYCLRPWRRLPTVGHELTLLQRCWAAALVPLIRVVGDVAKMVGYPVGLWWRYKNRDRTEIYWQEQL